MYSLMDQNCFRLIFRSKLLLTIFLNMLCCLANKYTEGLMQLEDGRAFS